MQGEVCFLILGVAEVVVDSEVSWLDPETQPGNAHMAMWIGPNSSFDDSYHPSGEV